MKKNRNPVSSLVAGIVIVAALATILVEGGWWLWLPALFALGVVAHLWAELNR